MSLWLYIKKGPWIQPNDRGGVGDYAFGNMVYHDAGQYHIIVNRDLFADVPFPEGLMEVVTHISIIECWNAAIFRQEGVYSLRTASATVRYRKYDKEWGFEMRANAENLDDLRDLSSRVMAGTILPDTPFKGEQKSPVMHVMAHCRAIGKIITEPTRKWCARFIARCTRWYQNA